MSHFVYRRPSATGFVYREIANKIHKWLRGSQKRHKPLHLVAKIDRLRADIDAIVAEIEG